ncbi:Galactose-binding domain-like protein [Niveomyces insectorum RCEF 264]|uniref:Galactose-binding domain-like protein n=1 Tax=Niveomyces insectorum RCEF 264 TaxID=1081102 RepID=A0A162JCX0_9HYPO|nr:Galactose-binding domain-like protein [Niveomyces insectorum RCEF 264]
MASQGPPQGLEARERATLAKVLSQGDENAFSVSEHRIPMADGIELRANLYQPDLPAGSKPRGLLYVHSPYGRTGIMALVNSECFASRGYAVLLVSCRGTDGSGGTFVAAMHEQADTQAVVRWMRAQPWYPGTFATFGPSYLGYTQWALLRDPPADLVASVILCAVYDHARLAWMNGAYRTDRVVWSYFVSRQDAAASSGGSLASVIDPVKLNAAVQATPLYDAAADLFEGKASYQLDFMKKPNVDGAAAFAQRLTLATYARVRDRGMPVYLTVGPWTHTEACGASELPEVFAFLDKHVAGRTVGTTGTTMESTSDNNNNDYRPLPVNVAHLLPPRRRDARRADAARAADAPSASFTYDPNNPTPSLGGPLLAGGGRADDSAYASRADVLVYTSAPLEADLALMGPPVVHLAHATDVPHADLWVRLSEVGTDGVSHNLTEGWQALDGVGVAAGDGGAARPDGAPFSLALVDRAHVFQKGTRIRVIVAGGSFPMLVPNPGTGVNRTLARERKAVTHIVQHGNGISKLVLPCLA